MSYISFLQVVQNLRTVVAQVIGDEPSGLVKKRQALSLAGDAGTAREQEGDNKQRPHSVGMNTASEKSGDQERAESLEDAIGEEGRSEDEISKRSPSKEEGRIKGQDSNRQEDMEVEKEHRVQGGIKQRQSSREDGLKEQLTALDEIEEQCPCNKGQSSREDGTKEHYTGMDSCSRQSLEESLEPHPQVKKCRCGNDADCGNVGGCGSESGKQVSINEHLSKMDGAIHWLEEALRSIKEFKQGHAPSAEI